MARFPVSLLIAALAALLAGCSDTHAPRAASIAIAPRVATLALGDSAQLTATVSDRGGKVLTGAAVAWASADAAVVTVSSTGLLRAVAPGHATISAVAEDARDTLSVAVSIRFVQVAGGIDRLCGIASNGAAFCRGANEYGQLGNGTTTASDTFVPVAGGHRFGDLQLGQHTTCALAADSTAWCWGSGLFGALGTGDTLTRTSPAAVAGGRRYVALAVGAWHACAVTAGGATYCWGQGAYGQTGDSSGADHSAPLLLEGAPAFVALSAGGVATCGITAAQAAWCWGFNGHGQLGAVTDTVFHEPVAVLGGQTFLTLAMRDQYCGVTSDGEVRCWHAGDYGGFWQTPADGLRYTALGTAWEHACGLASDSTVYCWGFYVGGSRAVTQGGSFTSVTTGDYADCAVSTGGTAYCWFLHCGYAEDVVCSEPPLQFPVQAARPVTAVSAGPDFNACALEDDGTVACFYLDAIDYPPTADSVTTPVAVPGGLTFRSVVVGTNDLRPLLPSGDFACGLAADSTAYCWTTHDGWSSVPRVTVSNPVAVPGGLRYTSLDTYGNHVCGIAVGGAAYCWRPGDAAPNLVPGGRSFARIFSAWRADCAIDAAGKAYCWGWNSDGELGLGFKSNQALTPVTVSGGHAFGALAVGSEHACALAGDGGAWCWGDNSLGELGTGDTTQSSAPRAVTGGLSYTSLVASASNRTCGLDANGAAYCWGTGVTAPAPQQAGTHFISLAPSSPYGICGVTTAGEIVCRGATAARASHRSPTIRPAPADARRPVGVLRLR